ncbi:MAG TPA: TraB/VirB10 family protein [Planctomycetota bacterium]|nr:TraB/VirB10 family protein [Planctomycetota bacterium]
MTRFGSLLKVASRKKLIVTAAITLILAVAFLALAKKSGSSSGTTSPAEAKPPDHAFEVGIPTLQKVEAFVSGYGSRVESAETELARLRSSLEATQKELRESIDKLSTARKEEAGLIRSAIGELTQTPGKEIGPPGAAALLPRVRKFDVPPSPEGESASQVRAVHIPAGSFGEVTILTGIFAPVTGEALPIHAKLDAALIGPNRTRIPVKDAFLVGRVQGDANSSRAVVQFQKLAFVTPSGETVEAAINADVADSDGILGLSGRYIWRAQEILTLSGFSGAASGAAEGFSQSELSSQFGPLGGGTSVVTGDPSRYAGYRGASKGLEKISEVLGKRLDEIGPAVYVPNGRKATILFIEGATLPRFDSTEANKHAANGADRRPFGGLDFDR